MFDNKFDKAAEAAKNFRLAISDMKTDRAGLDADRQVLLQQREELYLQPVSNADMQQFLFDYIDARAAFWEGLCGWDNVIKKVSLPARNPDFAEHHGITTRGLCLRDIELVMAQPGADNTQALGIKSINFYGDAGPALSAGSDTPFYFFFGDLVKKKIADRFDTLCPRELGKPGIPVAERKAKIQELDAEIAALTARIDQINDNLKELGGGE
ncbi:TPA: hypothetical protein ACKRPO_005759 [Pseudomonas aeruginosa]|nr:hypothetical protein [Pseudomonas aeruginosa]